MAIESPQNPMREEDRKKYSEFVKKISEKPRRFQEIDDEIKYETQFQAEIEDKFRETVTNLGIGISKDDLNSILNITMYKGARCLHTLDGIYVDTGRSVIFRPLTHGKMVDFAQGEEIFLSKEEIDGFRKRYPFDELLKASQISHSKIRLEIFDELEKLDNKLNQTK